jgi:predicted TIM-barrel enzyme
LKIADGVIVGTALKKDGRTANPVHPETVRQLVRAAQTARS